METGWEKVDRTVSEAVARFAAAARRRHPGCAVYLFGSQAKGLAGPGSDIDVAVVVDEIEGGSEDPWPFMAAADELTVAAADVDDRLEPHLIEAGRDDSGFLSVVTATGLLVA